MSMDLKSSSPQTAAQTLNKQALARRHVLLRGLGKGAAVMGAVVPIQTFSAQTLLTFDGKYLCSVSGTQSAVNSTTTSSALACGGYSPASWVQSESKRRATLKWPVLPNGWTAKTQCRKVFTRSVLMKEDGHWPSLIDVMEANEKNSRFAASDEIHWICAWLNALSGSFNYPYTGQQVLDYYNQGFASKSYQDALFFFKTYMENN
jgi:hypothetical protein